MESRKEDEKNEKIIRGLMKLPPNRRCINCNSLGPQYVCTNFWTFICMTCGGIHREFTHRVKSVSMAKFTSQEVEALQNGGNQRAREMYLKDWDFQRQRLPDSSNVNKIREFIRNVYVDRRYAGAKSSDKPPRDTQSPRICEDETRRASSYHSYSQSPPYDYQYEDRRYGKQAAALTRKFGSDKGRYEGKMSSFIYSPGRLSDQAYDDRFANEGSGRRICEYSVSSGGEHFKSDVQSPKCLKDVGFSSSSHKRSSASSSEDVWAQARNMLWETNAKRDADATRHPQKTTSFGSIDGNPSSLRSFSTGGLVDLLPETVQASGSLRDKFSATPQPSNPARSVSVDLSKAPVTSELFSSSTPSVDLFQLQASSQASSVDLFQPTVLSSAPSLNENQPSQISQPSSFDFFADIFEQQPAATSDEKSPELSVPRNEGWATFDVLQCMTSAAQVETNAPVPSTDNSLLERFDPFLTFDGTGHLPSVETTTPNKSIPWHGGVQSGGEQVSVKETNPQVLYVNTEQPWNAFEDSGTPVSADILDQGLQLHILPSTDDQFFGGSNNSGMQGIAPIGGYDDHNITSHASGAPYTPFVLPLMGQTQPNGINRKSTNPFDLLPFDSDVEHNDMFLDMSSLQATLPDARLPPAFNNGITEPWLPQNTVNSYISSLGQGGLTYMAAQPPSSQILNVQTQGPVAPLGGNPFA